VAAFIVPRSSVCAALGEACLLLTEMYQMISFGPVFTVFSNNALTILSFAAHQPPDASLYKCLLMKPEELVS
jgi:hypothetical protein